MEKMRSTRRTLRIVCDEPSHAPKVAHVQRFRVRSYEDGQVTLYLAGPVMPAEGTATLDAAGVPIDPLEFGTSTKPPSERAAERAWQRYALECPLCGLRLVLRHETAVRVAVRLLADGVSQVSLSALAAKL